MILKQLTFEEIDDLKQEWTGRYVEVDESRPELRRFARKVGQVVTVNMSGKALVQFDQDWGRYDIGIAFLRQVAAPKPAVPVKLKAAAAKTKPKGKPAPAVKKGSPLEQLKAAAAKSDEGKAGPSKLEQIRAKAAAAKSDEGKARPSKLEQIRAATEQQQDDAAVKPAVKGEGESSDTKPEVGLSKIEQLRRAAAAKKQQEDSSEKDSENS